jgi:hypothetical protein
MLFWLSLIPLVTDWIDENNLAPLPVALYGVVLPMTGCAYMPLSRAPIASDGTDSALGRAVGNDRKGIISLLVYSAAIPLSFVNAHLAVTLYVLLAALWFIPDRRIERMLLEMPWQHRNAAFHCCRKPGTLACVFVAAAHCHLAAGRALVLAREPGNF